MTGIIYPYNTIAKLNQACELAQGGMTFHGVIPFESENIVQSWFDNLIIKGIAYASAEARGKAHYVLSHWFKVSGSDKSESFLVTTINDKNIFSLEPNQRMLQDENYTTRVINHLESERGIKLIDKNYLFSQAHDSIVIYKRLDDLNNLATDNVEVMGRIESDGPGHTFIPRHG